MNTNLIPKKGAEINLEIESLAFGGMGVAHYNNIVVFVKNSIPGQTVSARITKKKSSYLEAHVIKTIIKSVKEIDPPCKHFITCGGCSFQNMAYNEQLKEKEFQTADIFKRIGGFKKIDCKPIVGCKQQFQYRNKMEFTFGNHEWIVEEKPANIKDDFVLGLHVPKRYDKILNIDNCHLQSDLANNILNHIKLQCKESNILPYDVKKHTGFLRFLIIRHSHYTNQIMINIVSNYKDLDLLSPIVKTTTKLFNNIKCFVNTVSSKKSNISKGEEEYILYGDNSIYEKLNGLTFKISPESFFQPNTLQAEQLYKLIKEEANLNGSEILYDLFCGTGTIGIYLAKYCKSVYGFEMVMSSINDAIVNANLNNIKNITFICGDLMNVFQTNIESKGIEKPDIIIIDPPRPGIHLNTIKVIVDKLPKKIIYVSCNPATQARDVKLLCDSGYKLKKISPVDMFPHTPHIENVATLTLRE